MNIEILDALICLYFLQNKANNTVLSLMTKMQAINAQKKKQRLKLLLDCYEIYWPSRRFRKGFLLVVAT